MIQHKKNTHKPTSANPNKNKPASRLSTKSKKTYLNHIPDSMDPDSPHIDLSNNRISSLKGIHMYTNLQYLNLSHNNIS